MCIYKNTSGREIPFWIQSVLTQCPQLHENLQEETCLSENPLRISVFGTIGPTLQEDPSHGAKDE